MRKLIIILILICCNILSHPQDLPISEYTTLEAVEFIVTYSMESKRDSLNLDYIRKEEALLFIGKNISYYTSKNQYVDLQERRKFTTILQLQEFYKNKGNFNPGFNYLVFKNYPNGKLTYTKPTLDGYFRFEESLDLFNWQLTGDTTTISGYKSQKAICNFGGRSWIDWFSPEIPFNDGFEISEEDLRMRGPGDLQGKLQSEVLDLKIADLIKDEKILKYARNLANDILDKDPSLEAPEHAILKKQLIKLFKNKPNWGLIS